MTTLVINGQKVTVGDSFLSLSPEEQNRTVDEIAKSVTVTTTPPPVTQSPEMTAGLSGLSETWKNPPAPEKTWGETLSDTFAGGKDVMGASAAGLSRGVSGMADLAVAGLPGLRGADDALSMVLQGAGIGEGPRAGNPALPNGNMAAMLSSMSGGGSEFRGETLPGKFAGTVAEFVPGAVAMGGGSLGNILRYGVAPGLASEGAGQLTEGTAAEPWARMAGALAGGIVPDLAMKGISKLVSPHGGADPARLKLASTLDDAGVPMTAGQRVGSEALRRKEGFTQGGQDLMETQAEAFTRAALKTAGTDAARASPDVLKETASRIGKVFDDVTQGVDVTPDASAVTALSQAVNTYKSLAPTGNQAPLISDIFKSTVKALRGGNVIPATTLKVWRSNLSKLTTSADSATREAAAEALNAVDDMMEVAIKATGKPENIARLAEARGQWRNFLAIQKAASGAGEGAAAGIISPSALRGAVAQQGRSAYAQGTRGDIAELARAGEGVIKKLPTSGTAENLRALMPSGSLFGALGAGGGAMTGNPALAALGAVGGAMVPGALGALRMSKPMQAYLANQLMKPAATNIGRGAASGALPFLGDRRLLPQ